MEEDLNAKAQRRKSLMVLSSILVAPLRFASTVRNEPPADVNFQGFELIRRRDRDEAEICRTAGFETVLQAHEARGDFGEVRPDLAPGAIEHVRGAKNSI